MDFKVKIVEATSPFDLEKFMNEAFREPEVQEYEVHDVKYIMTPMPGAKVSRGGIFYFASILFRKD